MFGPKIRNVFKSRWNALFWSLGVLLTAYCSVPAAEQAEHGARKDKPAHHVSPWAKQAGKDSGKSSHG